MRKPAYIGLVMALAGIAVASYAASSRIYEYIEPNTGLRTLSLEDVHTHNCVGVTSVPGDLKLAFFAQQTGDHQVLYSLSPALTSGMRINIRRGDTMDYVADGHPGQLSSAAKELAGHEHANHAIYVHETAPFPITRAQLDALSETQVFQLTINGKNNSIERCVYAKDLKDLPEFLKAAQAY